MRARLTALGELLLGKQDSAALRGRLLAGVAGLLSLRVAFGAMAFTLTVMLARLLGHDGLGQYSYALAWVTLLGAPAVLGMDQLLVREIPPFEAKSEWGLMRGALRVAGRVVSITSLVLMLLTLIASWFLRDRAAPGTVPTLWMALPLVPLIAFTRVRQGMLQGLHRVVQGAMPERLLLPGSLLLLLLAARVADVALTATVAMGLNVAATIIAFTAGAVMLRRNIPAPMRLAAPEYRTAPWLRGALPILLLNSVGVLLSQADVLIVGTMKGSGIVGLYGVADRTADLLSFVLLAQSAAFASTASSLHAAGEHVALQRLTTRIARLTLLPTLLPALVFIFFGRQFLTLFYGVEYAPAIRPLAILSLGQLVNVVAGLNGMLLIMTNNAGEAVKAVAASAAANIVLNLLLVPRWGMDGAAAANTASLVVLNVLASRALRRKAGLRSSVVGARGGAS